MPVTTSKYAYFETIIFNFITQTLGYNVAVACGILANAEAESAFNPYEDRGDGGTSYGLFQWHADRMKKLFSMYGSKPKPIDQLKYLQYELNGSESRAKTFLDRVKNNAQGAYDAGSDFCYYYERPSDSKNKAAIRGAAARDKYWKYYQSTVVTPLLGQSLADEAKKHIGKEYKANTAGPRTFDQGGFIYYCYDQVSPGLINQHLPVNDYYTIYKSTAKIVHLNEVAPGDLVFYASTVDPQIMVSVGIAISKTTMIYMSPTNRKVEEFDFNPRGEVKRNFKNYPAVILRILSESQVPTTYYEGGDSAELGGSSVNYDSLTIVDPYSSALSSNLSRVKEEGFDYGYLIDITHKDREFKFYIPEFSEQAGAQWSSIDIKGRSVQVFSYHNTNSRNINVSLDLYAGEGLYKATPGETGEETVSRLHSDVNFVKSLEYPDYENAITRPPATVQLILGPNINIAGIVSNVVVNHKKPLDSQNRAMYVTLSFTVTQIASNPPDFRDIRNGQYNIPATNDAGSLGGASNTNTPVYTYAKREEAIS